MNNIKTIADFKRVMTPGTVWECTHRYIGTNPSEPKSLGRRQCVLNNSVGFGFRNETTGETSHCDWPKKSELTTEDDGNVIVLTKPGFCELRYREVV